MKCMRILFVINGLAGGGAEKLMNDMLPLMNDDTHTCDLLILSDKNQKYLDSLRSNGINVTVAPAECRNRSSHFKRIRFIKKFIKAGNYDIVHANLFPVIYYCSIIKKLSGKNFPHLVMTEHNTDNRRRHHIALKPIEQYIYSSYDRVISISDQVQEQLVNWLHPSSKWTKKFVVIYNGVPVQRFMQARPYPKSELFPGISDTDVLLCMVGSFTEQKNHEGMIDVMAALPDNYKLLLVGEGPLYGAMTEKIRQMRLDERIVCLGFRKDVAEIMHTADIIVIPSRWEGFGLIAVEAVACGKPVVASNVPGLGDIVAPAGVVFDYKYTSKFKEAIINLQDPKEYERCCKQSHNIAAAYSIENMCKSYCDVFSELM